MKFSFIYLYFLLSLLLISFLLFSCQQQPAVTGPQSDIVQKTDPIGTPPSTAKRQVSQAFRSYWYAGTAEISTYHLTQARYGELRQGESTLIFVTEPFRTDLHVKADQDTPEATSVLKLNSVKKYLTGIYPYSIMESTFTPIFYQSHPLKSTLTVQEWCGHVFAQFNLRERYQVQAFSYFESEGDQDLTLEPTYLESELWSLIRLDPEELPLGTFPMVPSLEYTRVKHREIRAYTASAGLEEQGELRVYRVTYPELERTLAISFERHFPFRIQGWEDTYTDGSGPLTTRAELNQRKLLPYWQLNRNQDSVYRDSLGLSL